MRKGSLPPYCCKNKKCCKIQSSRINGFKSKFNYATLCLDLEMCRDTFFWNVGGVLDTELTTVTKMGKAMENSVASSLAPWLTLD